VRAWEGGTTDSVRSRASGNSAGRTEWQIIVSPGSPPSRGTNGRADARPSNALSVMRGLDPRIHDEMQRCRQYCLPFCFASWMAGSCLRSHGRATARQASPAMTAEGVRKHAAKAGTGTNGVRRKRATRSASCPGLSRASTSLNFTSQKGVDGRNKSGHDRLGRRWSMPSRRHGRGQTELGASESNKLRVMPALVAGIHVLAAARLFCQTTRGWPDPAFARMGELRQGKQVRQ